MINNATNTPNAQAVRGDVCRNSKSSVFLRALREQPPFPPHLNDRVKTIDLVGGIYTGEVNSASKPHGLGSLILMGGGSHHGHFIEGDFDEGVRLFKGIRFEGKHKQGLLYFGKITWPSGQTYEGECEKGQPKGKGKLIDINGSVYNGIFDTTSNFEGLVEASSFSYIGKIINSEASGKGFYTDKITNTVFDAFFENFKTGVGKIKSSFFGLYEGPFKNGCPDGIGILITPEGIVFEGKFSGYMKGEGTITSIRGVYRGEFAFGVPYGAGIFEDIEGNLYEGDFIGPLSGNGKIYYKDGSTYEGNFILGRQTGRGIATDLSGNRFIVNNP